MRTALTIAGSDSSGGAGIQADIKTMITNGVYAMSAITALTAQNTTGVQAILNVTPEFLGQELDSVFQDIYPDAVKIGMVSDKDLIHVIAEKLKQYKAENIVVDPVMVATSGAKLISDDAVEILKQELFPLADVLTPNIPEAEELIGRKITSAEEMIDAAKEISEKYHCAVILIGHMNKNSNGKSSYRGLGSIDFQAAARSVLIVGRVKDEPEVRVVCHTKSSLAPEGTSIAFRLDKNNGFEWIGEYDISADELLNGDGRGQKSRKAKEFLLEILANGGMTQKKIAEEAEARGIKSKTLWNAKRELEIDSVKRGKQWYWMLPE